MASPEANDSCTVTSGRTSTPIELSWDAVSGVSSYQIWRAGSENTFSNSFASDRILVSSTSGTTYTDSSATHGRQTYQYVVFPPARRRLTGRQMECRACPNTRRRQTRQH